MNPNIALAAQRPQFNALGARREAAQIQAAQQQQQYNALAMQNQQQQMAMQQQALERNEMKRQALAGVDWTAPTAYEDAARLLAPIDPEAAAGFAQQMQSRKLGDLNLDAKSLEVTGKRAELGARLFNPEIVKDQASWDAARAQAAELGWPVPESPYSPEATIALWRGSLGVKDQIDAMHKDRTAKRDDMKFDETKRHNLAIEAKPGMQVNIGGDKKREELDAITYSDMWKNIQDGARESDRRVMDYQLIDKLIGPAYSGKAGAGVQEVKKAAKMLGLDLGDVAGPEAAAMVSNELALRLRNPAGGAGMPGAMSDKDREFLQGMVPGIGTTKEGRQLMIEVQKRIAKRNSEIAKDAREYRRKNRYLDYEFEGLIAEKYEGRDLFADLIVPGAAPQPAASGFDPSRAVRN